MIKLGDVIIETFKKDYSNYLRIEVVSKRDESFNIIETKEIHLDPDEALKLARAIRTIYGIV